MKIIEQKPLILAVWLIILTVAVRSNANCIYNGIRHCYSNESMPQPDEDGECCSVFGSPGKCVSESNPTMKDSDAYCGKKLIKVNAANCHTEDGPCGSGYMMAPCE